MDLNKYKAKIREVDNFPIPGVKFRDITPLLEDQKAFREIIDELTAFFKDEKVDKVVGIDARGFLLAAPVAYLLGAGQAIMRKKGKLPHQTIVEEFDLEYGRTKMEIHIDAIKKGERVIIIDDVLATGGTAGAAVRMVNQLGGEIVGLGFLLEIGGLGGRKQLRDYPIRSLITY
ncbi:MAG: adenine phosphoribosyltransferase [Candidatus Harrisonbacteria bacterium]|nr:adenine phosphoribosyltransferase [Candidatus Harrisonbacteria bacterium]